MPFADYTGLVGRGIGTLIGAYFGGPMGGAAGGAAGQMEGDKFGDVLKGDSSIFDMLSPGPAAQKPPDPPMLLDPEGRMGNRMAPEMGALSDAPATRANMAEAKNSGGFDFGRLLTGVGQAVSGTAAGLQGDNDYFGRLQAQMDRAADRQQLLKQREQEFEEKKLNDASKRREEKLKSLNTAMEISKKVGGNPEHAKLMAPFLKESLGMDDETAEKFLLEGESPFKALKNLHRGLMALANKDPSFAKTLDQQMSAGNINYSQAVELGNKQSGQAGFEGLSQWIKANPEEAKNLTNDKARSVVPDFYEYMSEGEILHLRDLGAPNLKPASQMKKEGEAEVETASSKAAAARQEDSQQFQMEQQNRALTTISANTNAQIAASERGRVESEDRRRKADEDRETSRRLQNESRMRKEFTSQSKPFIDMVDTKKKIEASAKDPSAAGDLSMIFAYMKMLDPISVVREGEQATAASARGVPDSVRNIYNRVVTGQRLTPTQRKDFVDRAGKLFDAGKSTHTQRVQEFRRTATASEIDPEKVIIDFEGQPSGAPSQSEIEAAKKRLGITK